MEKTDFKKLYKQYYMPKSTPSIIELPSFHYIAVMGKGDPNEANGEYAEALKLLYALVFTIKMSKMGEHKLEDYYEYVMPPLEGLWWMSDLVGMDYRQKSKFHFVSMIAQPDFVDESVFEWACAEVKQKKGLDTSKAKFITLDEGTCVTCMHFGSYDDEPETIKKLHQFACDNGYEVDISNKRRHHEIYLSDPRKTKTEKLKTVLRIPIKKKQMNNYIKVDPSNIDKEHICCALSGSEADTKKNWMKQHFVDGYTFIKLNERGKVFIDYVPAEAAFAPIDAPNIMFIYCLWVSGKYVKQGHAGRLLAMAEEDAKKQGKDGMIFISSRKKKPYLADYTFLSKKGYEIVDEGYDDYILLFKSFNEQANKPRFAKDVKDECQRESGLILYYDNQCVFSEKYVRLVSEKAKARGWNLKTIKLNSRKEVYDNKVISPVYSLFYNGKFITNEIMSVAKFEKEVEKQYAQTT